MGNNQPILRASLQIKPGEVTIAHHHTASSSSLPHLAAPYHQPAKPYHNLSSWGQLPPQRGTSSRLQLDQKSESQARPIIREDCQVGYHLQWGPYCLSLDRQPPAHGGRQLAKRDPIIHQLQKTRCRGRRHRSKVGQHQISTTKPSTLLATTHHLRTINGACTRCHLKAAKETYLFVL